MSKTQLRIKEGSINGMSNGWLKGQSTTIWLKSGPIAALGGMAQEVSLPSSSIMLAVEVLSDELC